MKKLPFSVSAIEQAMAVAIDRKLEIAEDRSFTQMAKAVVAYVNCKAMHSDKYLMTEALHAIDVFAAREASLVESLTLTNATSTEYTETVRASITRSNSEVSEAFNSSKQELLSAKQDLQVKQECEKHATDLSTMPKRAELENSILTINRDIVHLSATRDNLERAHAKRMKKLEYITSTALELKT